MPATPELTDGILPTGVFDVTMLESGIAYAANNFSADVDAVIVRRKNPRGGASGQKFLEAFTDGTCDLQLATSTTAKPKVGFAFLADEDGDGTAEPWLVQKPGKTFEQEGETKLKLAISRAVNPVIYGSSGRTTAELYAGLSVVEDVLITPFTLAAYLPPGLTLTAATWAAAGLPAGVSIDATTGVVSGTPTTPSINYVKVTVSATKQSVRNGALVTDTFTGVREFVFTITATP
jgi:hypothetical protein